LFYHHVVKGAFLTMLLLREMSVYPRYRRRPTANPLLLAALVDGVDATRSTL